jgi:hypothetical protein
VQARFNGALIGGSSGDGLTPQEKKSGQCIDSIQDKYIP